MIFSNRGTKREPIRPFVEGPLFFPTRVLGCRSAPDLVQADCCLRVGGCGVGFVCWGLGYDCW